MHKVGFYYKEVSRCTVSKTYNLCIMYVVNTIPEFKVRFLFLLIGKKLHIYYATLQDTCLNRFC